MFKDEAAILQAAAMLAAAEHTAAALARGSGGGQYAAHLPSGSSAVDRLVGVLRAMEKEGIIGQGFAPPQTP